MNNIFLLQDVSEFQHKLLDWLEDAFRLISLSSSPSAGSELHDIWEFYVTVRFILCYKFVSRLCFVAHVANVDCFCIIFSTSVNGLHNSQFEDYPMSDISCT